MPVWTIEVDKVDFHAVFDDMVGNTHSVHWADCFGTGTNHLMKGIVSNPAFASSLMWESVSSTKTLSYAAGFCSSALLTGSW
jgi:hypothetical protein